MSEYFAVTLFVMSITAAILYLPFKVEFSRKWWLNGLIKRSLWAFGLILVSLDAAIVADLATAAGLAINSELMLFVWLAHRAAYIMLLWMMIAWFFDLIAMFQGEKEEKRMGRAG